MTDLQSNIYKSLIKNDVIHKYTGPIHNNNKRHSEDDDHYVTKNGTINVVRFLLSEATKCGLKFAKNRPVTRIDIETDGIDCSTENYREKFDSIILAFPLPNILNLEGNIKQILEQPKYHTLRDIKYSSRFSLALYYSSVNNLPLDYTISYIEDSAIIRFISWDNKKRDNMSGSGSTLLVHTSVPFSIENMTRDRTKLEDIIMTELRRLRPFLPNPDFTYLHYFQLSQVSTGLLHLLGGNAKCEECLVLCKEPLLILTGDYFSVSNMDGCVRSAMSCYEHILTNI